MRNTRDRRNSPAYDSRENPKHGGYLGAIEGIRKDEPDSNQSARRNPVAIRDVPPDEAETAEYVCVR